MGAISDGRLRVRHTPRGKQGQEPVARQEAVGCRAMSWSEFNPLPNSRGRDGLYCKLLKVKDLMAEREGFEPPIPFRVCRFSRPVPSTTRPSLRICGSYSI